MYGCYIMIVDEYCWVVSYEGDERDGLDDICACLGVLYSKN